MTPFWAGFLTGVWIGPFAVVLGLFLFTQCGRWTR